MNTHSMTIALLLAVAAGDAVAAEPAPGIRYTAVLHQRINYWQLVPPDGAALQVTTRRSACPQGRALPRGEWSVVRTADGRTLLRPTFAEAPRDVRLVPCGDAADDEASLHAPAALIDWIAGVADKVVIE